MAKGVQAPFLALVKSRMAHDGVVSSVLQTYHYDLLQPEELCDLMLVLPIKTKHELWKWKSILLGYPKPGILSISAV